MKIRYDSPYGEYITMSDTERSAFECGLSGKQTYTDLKGFFGARLKQVGRNVLGQTVFYVGCVHDLFGERVHHYKVVKILSENKIRLKSSPNRTQDYNYVRGRWCRE